MSSTSEVIISSTLKRIFLPHDAESQRVGSGGIDLVVKWLQWQPDWEKESYPEINDLVLMPIFAIIFPLVRYLLDSFIFEVCLQSLSFSVFSYDDDVFSGFPKSIRKDKIEQSKNVLLCLFCVVRRRMTCETGNVCFRETKCIYIRSHIAIFFDLCCCEMVV
jgi:hypothetical protein